MDRHQYSRAEKVNRYHADTFFMDSLALRKWDTSTERVVWQVTSLFTGYVGALLEEAAANPAGAWQAKDCAIYLVHRAGAPGQTLAWPGVPAACWVWFARNCPGAVMTVVSAFIPPLLRHACSNKLGLLTPIDVVVGTVRGCTMAAGVVDTMRRSHLGSVQYFCTGSGRCMVAGSLMHPAAGRCEKSCSGLWIKH